MLGGSVQLAKSTSLYMESAHRNLSRGLNRLSSGVKLSTGVDDAGGLGVSMNIGAKLKKAFKVRENVQNARSFLEQQDAALSSMGKALDRMAELRTKIDDVVAGRSDRELYNKEFKEMQSEILSMRGRKFNGVSIFSTDAKDPLSFYIPTSEDGISTQVAINRTGFFDSLTIGSSTPGSTPSTTFNGVTGSFAGSVQVIAGGAITSVTRSPVSGLHATPIDFTIAAGGTVADFPATPLIGASPAVGITVAAGGTVADFPATPLIGASPAVGITVAAGGTVADFSATPVKGAHTAIPVTVVEGTRTTVTATALQGTGSHTENVTAFAGEDISIPTTGGNAAEIPAWTANPVTPNGNISQTGVADGSGNLWFVTDDGRVQKVEGGDPAAAGTGVLTTIPSLNGADYVSKSIILDISGQEFMFVAGQDGPNEARLHKINLSTGARQEFTQVSGGNETLRGLSEQNGKLYMAYSRSAGFGQTRGEIVRVNSDMTRDNGWGNSSGRVMNTNAHNGWDFGNDGESRVDMAFDGGNLYVQMDNGVKSRIKSFDVATGTVSADNDFSANGFISSGVGGGTQVHSPVIDGGNVYAAVDSTAFGTPSQIIARQVSGAAIAGWNDITLPGSEKTIESPVINGANLYVSTDQGNVYKYDKMLGGNTPIASFASGSANNLTMPVFDGTDFYVGQGNGRVHKVDSATMTRDGTWPAPGVSAAGAVGSAPLVVGTEVYVGSPGRIQGFEAPAGGVTITNKINVAGGNDYLTTHSAGDTFAVTVNDNGGTLTDWTGTATVVNDGGVGKLNLTGFSGTDDLTGNANVTVVTPAVAPILPASVSFGTNYTALENPTVTVTKPDLTTQNLPAADITNNGDGTLTVSLANVVLAGTGNYDLTASAGSRYLQATTFNDQGAVGAYPDTETPQLLSVTDAGGFTVTGISTTSAVADANGQLDVVLAGTPSATGTLTLTFEGAMTATPGGPFANVGTNYAPGEVVLVTTNIPEQGGGGNFLTATATNNNDGTLTISAFNGIPSSGSSTAANAYNVTADAGTIHYLPDENPAAATGSYVNGEVVGVTLTDTGTGLAPVDATATPITATGTGQPDGSVLIVFSGTPTSATPITAKVDPGNLTAAATTPGSLTGVGTGYATVGQGEALNVGAVTTVPGLTVAATNQNDGTVNVALSGAVTPGTAPGAYTVTANAGTLRHLTNENPAAATGSYVNGEVVGVTLTDTGTGLAPVDATATPITATGTGQLDGSVLIAFSGTPTSANPITVNVAPGNLTAAPTTPGSLTGVGTGYATGEAVTANVTGVAGMSATATNNNDGTLNLTLSAVPAGTPPGTYQVQANPGTMFQLSNETIAADSGSYGNGEIVAVTLTDVGTGLTPAGGLTASGIGQVGGSLQITFTNSTTSANDILIAPATGSPSLAQTSLSNVGSGYNPAEPVPTIIVTDPGGTNVTGTASVTGINVDGTLNVDLTGVSLTAASPTGTYTIATSNGTIASIPTALNGIGSGYSQAEPAPVVTVTDPVSATLAGATASINANGTIDVNLAGVAATAAGTYTVNATGGTVSGVQQGLDDTGKDLWDFSHADFNNFIQTLTDVRAVNGATTNSLAFSESRLETNIQNLELAGGRIVDADMAAEMVEVAKSQILLRAATDSLTKHNRLSVDVDRTLMGLSGGM